MVSILPFIPVHPVYFSSLQGTQLRLVSPSSTCSPGFSSLGEFIISNFVRFSNQRSLVVFHWSLKDSKSPYISRNLLSILDDCNNAVVGIFRFFFWFPVSPFDIPRAPTTIAISSSIEFNCFFFVYFQGPSICHSSLFHLFSFCGVPGWWGSPRGVMVKATDCRILVSEFVLQSCYCVQFRANSLGKSLNSLILPTMG